MKLFRQICFLLLVSSFIFGQSASNNTNSDDSRISNQIKSLQDAIAGQQQQIEQLRQELAARKQAESAPHLANASLTTSSTASMVQETEKPKNRRFRSALAVLTLLPAVLWISRTSFGQ